MTATVTKQTLSEWRSSQKCNDCGNPLVLDFQCFGSTTHKLRDVDFEKIKGFYCSNCYEEALLRLKNNRFVQRYKGQEIYYKDGKYSLWQSVSYCKSLEELQNWIDYKLVMPDKAKQEF